MVSQHDQWKIWGGIVHHKSWPQNMCHTHSWPQHMTRSHDVSHFRGASNMTFGQIYLSIETSIANHIRDVSPSRGAGHVMSDTRGEFVTLCFSLDLVTWCLMLEGSWSHDLPEPVSANIMSHIEVDWQPSWNLWYLWDGFVSQTNTWGVCPINLDVGTVQWVHCFL